MSACCPPNGNLARCRFFKVAFPQAQFTLLAVSCSPGPSPGRWEQLQEKVRVKCVWKGEGGWDPGGDCKCPNQDTGQPALAQVRSSSQGACSKPLCMIKFMMVNWPPQTLQTFGQQSKRSFSWITNPTLGQWHDAFLRRKCIRKQLGDLSDFLPNICSDNWQLWTYSSNEGKPQNFRKENHTSTCRERSGTYPWPAKANQ